ncbi:MAG: diaminopimelate decarboxylase [Clostridiales bacterium GWF2_36_10]|nr:MAG: diaminopimelate decarboxylase [Clostridiales bacterium GWF2_36_10]HAN20949.1 diaminopimelate decarboxylase [Clostridiales bacterium]
MLHDNITLGENGHLYFAGMDTVALAKKHGTPLYLIDENKIRENCRTYISCVKKYFGEKSIPLYASKALCYLDIYRILKEEGTGVDVVSGGELYTALKAGFPASLMFFHGNNKTNTEIDFAVKNDVGYFVVDNVEELEEVNATAARYGIKQNILLRLSPGIDPHTHKAVVTGSVDSKFGTAIETGQAMELTKYAISKSNIKLVGFHCHIGSQIFDHIPFSDAAKIMLAFIAKVQAETGVLVEMLNLGGGIGVRYIEEHPKVEMDSIFRSIKTEVDAFCQINNVKAPTILFEMGRYVSANAGMTLYTVGSFKTITGYKSYVSIDGGMPDNPRYALYQSPYTALIADRAGEKKTVVATIAGRCCESGDLIQENAPLQSCKKGDTLAVLVTGAYNYAMSSNYNRLPKPPIVSIYNKKDNVVVKRESYEDLCKNELATVNV